MTLLRASRLLQLLGLSIALAGLLGFWLARDSQPQVLSTVQQELLGLQADDFHTSFVVAGRDEFYEEGKSKPVYNEAGEIICWRYTGSRTAYGMNTDTVVYAGLTNDELTMIMLPRDLLVGSSNWRLNSIYQRQGAAGLQQAVSDLLGVPVEHHVIINLDIFQRLVDALGGVEVDVPTRMYRHDCAAGLTIDLKPGVQHLDGEKASHFVRFRDLSRGDIDRLDNIKLLTYGMVSRVRQLHVRTLTLLPELFDTFFEDVETNVSAGFVTRQLLPRAAKLSITSAGTLPTVDVTRGGTTGLAVDDRTVEEFLASAFGGSARTFSEAPEGTVLLTNRSGTPGLEEWYVERFSVMGVPAERLQTRTAESDASTTRVVATVKTWTDADYYSDLLGVGRQQIDRFNGERSGIAFEIVLGADALQPGTPRRTTGL